MDRLLLEFSNENGLDVFDPRLNDDALFLLFLFTICHALGEEGGVDAGLKGGGRL